MYFTWYRFVAMSRLAKGAASSAPIVHFTMFSSTPQGASKHIAALMQEREDYEQAIRTQALRIQQLEGDLAAANEQVEVQTLIGCAAAGCSGAAREADACAPTPHRDSRARQLEESREREEILDLKLSKLRSATRLLWGVLQEMQMRVAEQQTSVQAGNELLESLDGLLEADDRPRAATMPMNVGSPPRA